MTNLNLVKNNKDARVAVAMSGGVDSSVAAALLTKEYGKENVFGVTMRLFCYAEKSTNPKNCCNLEAINDAKAVCNKLGIRHFVLDFEKEFEKEVITNFVQEYIKGRTPNPCVRCNSIIKFEKLLKKTEELGADFLATGHYARITSEMKKEKLKKKKEEDYSSSKGEKFSNLNGKIRLLKGKDEKKDQSYFLYGIKSESLSKLLFPLGEHTKEEVRAMANKMGLRTAEKTESQEICFIEDANYHNYLKSRINTEEGDIVDAKGRTLGKHEGLPFYTIGQRKGLRIAYKEPLYVLGMNIQKNVLMVGEEKDLYNKEFEVKDINWLQAREDEFEAEVAVRYNMTPQKAKVTPIGKNRAKIVFKNSQRAITPGQSAVIYASAQKNRGTGCEDELIGGGIIV